MFHRTKATQRRGTVLVESAIVYPLTFMLILGMIVIGLGVFRYQQMAWLAREGARMASVRGYDYHNETGYDVITQSWLETYLRDMAAVPDPENVSITLTWNHQLDNGEDDTSSYQTVTDANGVPGNAIVNTVTVEVTYNWLPELYLTGPITLSSKSTMPISF